MDRHAVLIDKSTPSPDGEDCSSRGTRVRDSAAVAAEQRLVQSVLTVMGTRKRAEWAAGSLRRHPAFRRGEIVLEGPFEYREPALPFPQERFPIVYRGPDPGHEEVGCGVEPLDPSDEEKEFADRDAAEHACVAARRHIPAWDISDVHVEAIEDGGPWRLVWLHATVRLRGQPEPEQPRRPGS